MGHETILVNRKDRVGIITLNRPEYLNAINDVMGRELRSQISRFNEDKDIGAIVLTGAGRAFSSGADVGGFEAVVRGEKKSVLQRDNEFAEWPIFIKESKPIICAINGYAIGMGITMPLGCDIRLMSESARLSFRFAYIGLTPEYASTHLLTQVVGMGKAMEFMLTGRFIESQEAFDTGLVNYVCRDDALMEESLKIADQIAFNPEWQLGHIKRMIRDHQFLDEPAKVMEIESETFKKSQGTEAHQEFLTSFREKRSPNYHS
jgi:2-(1,2-epoxy-1,2-dihydrophenyl)acetyl-CoA isomerase